MPSKHKAYEKTLHNLFLFTIVLQIILGSLFGIVVANEAVANYFNHSENTEHISDLKLSQNMVSAIAPGSEIGMWVWQRDCLVDAWERILMLEFCKSHGVTRIFVQVHFNRKEDGSYELADKEAWHELLKTANLLDVKVDALDGAREMGFAENRPDTLARLRAVLDFHASQPKNSRFAGIHYDIEPYTTERWKMGEHREIALEFLETMVEVRKLISDVDPKLTLANDIPFWYDSDNKYIVGFNGSEKLFNEHIQDISDFIAIMSYRTEMVGANSVSDITSGELAYGAKIGRPVYLSIETVSLPSTPQITFYGRSPVEVVSAVRELIDARKEDISFGGVCLHEYQTLRLMGKQWDLSGLN